MDDPRAALAAAFYWVRDRIKYASIASANRDLGSPERAERIVAAGMGDCKDTSLLLAVACAHLGIPWEFVLMSAENGILLEELPADQFDHMLVRARPGDEWMYLDAAGDAAVFASPPFPFQGVTVLTGPEGGDLVTMSETPLERTRVVIHETIDAVDAGRLAGHVELRLEGHPARMVDEVWKHQSLMSLDPERAADEAIRHLLPDFEITDSDRLTGTTRGDTLHVVASGRRGRIVALALGAPGLPALARRRQPFSDRVAFLLRAEFEYRLDVAGPVRRVLRGISAVADLVAPFCTIGEERAENPTATGIVRRIRLSRRCL